MTVRRPDDDPPGGRALEMLTRDRHSAQWRADLAEQWATRLSGTAYIPMSRDAVQQCLLKLVDTVVAALEDPDTIAEAGRQVGQRLVEIHATGEESLPQSLELLRDSVVAVTGDGAVQRVLSLLTAVASGYAAADRASTFEQQESLKQALVRSKLQADQERETSEARFREVFTSTPIGVAICDLAGKFVDVNPALEETLGYRAQTLMSMTIHDLFHPEDAEYLTASYRELGEVAGTQRLRERRRLLRANGEQAWTYLAVSVLRDADGVPCNLVTMVEDISELHLLQERFQYQALRDAMTGLANRQFFRTRLEAALGNLPQDATLTLYHLALDSLELINDGLGYEVGDHIIKAVARRLEQLVEGEEAMVARFGGTEFAILVRDSPQTPSVPEFAAMINDELSEPIYINDHGIATSASIGVVQRTGATGEPANMMWAADVTLRRASAAGKRQWALFDPDRAPDERNEAKLAAVIPGALELGDFEVGYRPVMAMGDRRLIGLEAHLRWEPEGHGELGHAECLRLAERSGVTLSLRDWVLRSSWEQVGLWHDAGYRPRLIVDLSPNQSRDPDLVATVRGILEDSELNPRWMWLSMPMSALTGDRDEARENVWVLNEMGVHTALHDFRASPEELRYLRHLPVHSVRLSSDLIQLVHDSDGEDTPEAEAVARLVPLIRARDVCIIVEGLATEEQAQRWQAIGCDAGVGALYGEPISVADVPAFLRQVQPDQ